MANDLTRNTLLIYDDVRLCRSKRKEDVLLASNQIWEKGFRIYVRYGNVGYNKITDGVNTFADLPEVGGGTPGGDDASTLQGQPGSYYLNRGNHTGAQAISTVTGLQAALSDKADADDIPDWETLDGKPEFIAAGATATAARAAIQAGTSSLQIGTTGTTAMAGNTPIPAAATWSNIAGKPAFVAEGASVSEARNSIGAGTSDLNLGTSDTTAMAGNTPVVRSQQESGQGDLVLNILTFPNGQLPDIGDRVAGTLYIEEEA